MDDDGLIWVQPHKPKCVWPPPSTPPVIIPDDDSSPSPSSPLDPLPPSFDLKSVSDHLRSLANAVQDLSRPITLADLAVNPLPSPTLLLALPPEKVVELFHHPGSPLPAV